MATIARIKAVLYGFGGLPWAEHHKNENHHFSKELNKQRSGYNSYFDIVERCQKDVDDVHRLSSIKRLARKIRQSFCTGRLPLGGGGGRAKRSSIKLLNLLLAKGGY